MPAPIASATLTASSAPIDWSSLARELAQSPDSQPALPSQKTPQAMRSERFAWGFAGVAAAIVGAGEAARHAPSHPVLAFLAAFPVGLATVAVVRSAVRGARHPDGLQAGLRAQKAHARRWVALGGVGCAFGSIALIDAAWALSARSRRVGEKLSLPAFSRLADRLKAFGDDAPERIERAMASMRQANIGVDSAGGRAWAREAAYDLLNLHDVSEAAELFLRQPFDPRPRGPRGEPNAPNWAPGQLRFSTALAESRRWRERHRANDLTAHDHELVREAIIRAQALEAAIELRRASMPSAAVPSSDSAFVAGNQSGESATALSAAAAPRRSARRV
jgi:hypothetical protein